MSTKVEKQPEDFDVPAWLVDDEYGSEDFEVFTHRKTKRYIAARDAHDAARAEFDALSEQLLSDDDASSRDLSVGEVDPRMERLESLRDEVAEAVETVNALAAEVAETRRTITVQDRLTFDEIADMGDMEKEPFFDLLAAVATVDGSKLPADAWRTLARKCGVGQWASFQNDALEFLGQPGVTPDFSPLASPKPLE